MFAGSSATGIETPALWLGSAKGEPGCCPPVNSAICAFFCALQCLVLLQQRLILLPRCAVCTFLLHQAVALRQEAASCDSKANDGEDLVVFASRILSSSPLGSPEGIVLA